MGEQQHQAAAALAIHSEDRLPLNPLLSHGLNDPGLLSPSRNRGVLEGFSSKSFAARKKYGTLSRGWFVRSSLALAFPNGGVV